MCSTKLLYQAFLPSCPASLTNYPLPSFKLPNSVMPSFQFCSAKLTNFSRPPLPPKKYAYGPGWWYSWGLWEDMSQWKCQRTAVSKSMWQSLLANFLPLLRDLFSMPNFPLQIVKYILDPDHLKQQSNIFILIMRRSYHLGGSKCQWIELKYLNLL